MEHVQRLKARLKEINNLNKAAAVLSWDQETQMPPGGSAARAEQLWALVDALPPCQADLIRRAFVSGQTHQEIAEETGLPLGTVKSRIRLGLEKLRCWMRSATLAEVDC